ncbi:hypothetical protein SLA2020_460690 [Shorea laevis]
MGGCGLGPDHQAPARPKVLIPGKLTVLVNVTLNPKGLALVFPGLPRTDVVKWEEDARLGFMQGAPLMKKGGNFVSAMQ